MVLDAVEVAESHSGSNLARVFIKILQNFGIEDKILGVTCDNASVNDAMIEKMDDSLEKFAGQSSRTRCFAHVINLVAKTAIHQFDTPNGKGDVTSDREKEIQELADGIKLEDDNNNIVIDDNDNAEDDDLDGWVDEQELMTEMKKEE